MSSNYARVQSCVTNAGIPCVHMAWPVGSAPDLPWAVFYLDGASGFADDGRYLTRSVWIIELYQVSRNSTVEESLESSIAAEFGAFHKDEAWVDDEQCLMTIYEFVAID